MTDERLDSGVPKHQSQKSKQSHSHVESTEAAEGHVRHRKHRHGHHRRRREGLSEDEKTTTIPSSTVAVPLAGEDRPVFFIDRTGDPSNVVYGGNHGSSQRYHRWGYGNLIGLSRRYKISEDGSEAFVTGPTYDGPQRGHTKSLLNFRDDAKRGLVEIRAESNGAEDDGIRLQREYVEVTSSSAKHRKRKLSDGQVNNAPHPSKNAHTRQDDELFEDSESGMLSDSSIPHETEEDAYEEFRNDARHQRSIELNRATLDHPSDVDAWLALIAYQDDMFGIDDQPSGKRLSTTAQHNLADIKLALYEKALATVTDPEARERLIKGLMDQGCTRDQPSTGLWVRYLNFRQTDTVNFSYEECLSILSKCLKKGLTEIDLVVRDKLSIYAVLRTATFMWQSGYLERALAVWQSLLEFTFLRPRTLDYSTELSSFQTFWESEVPRIGELGVTGWALHQPSQGLSGSDPAVASASSDDDVYGAWALRETEAAISSVMPARTLDDVAEDDPFRVILYSDISDYIFRPNDNNSYALLINAFLKFCGLPPLHYQGSLVSREWCDDEFLSSCVLSKDQPLFIAGTAVLDTKTLFVVDDGLSIFPRVTAEECEPKTAWQRTALKQLVATVTDNDALAEYVVAFEASMDVKEARKYAKSLLKSRPSNLRIYNAYALLECRLDRFESAEHVWSTAITMCHSVSTIEQQNIARVWSSWILECLRLGHVSRAKMLLSSIPDGHIAKEERVIEAFSSAAIQLRIKNYLKSHFSQQLSLRQDDGVLYFTELLALFEYVASFQSISAALIVYNTTMETLVKTSTSSQLLETIHQSRARLLHLHPLISPQGYRPAEINKHLSESFRTFPNNTVLYQLYQEHSRRAGLLERIREVVPRNVLSYNSNDQETSIAPLLFAIQAEISRPSYGGSSNHSIRAAFERGVATATACARIWAWYIIWEASLDDEAKPVIDASKQRRKKQIDMRRNKAVDVYYRGVRACPWAKELYMLAFLETSLRKVIDDAELRKIYDTMMEKGLRIHVDLDQIMS